MIILLKEVIEGEGNIRGLTNDSLANQIPRRDDEEGRSDEKEEKGKCVMTRCPE